ncbi:MAG TPA: thiol peroxidase [Anaerolineales bacterium]|jgi:thiol peroxidase|nr:thiol peroxidase [Anaerolineales bacterium]
MERTGLLQIAGTDVTIIGPDIMVGQEAPEFTAQDQDWTFVDVLEATKGKVRVITALPSLTTSVCDAETRRFNQEAGSLDDNIAIVAISTDLPYTIKNWCAAAGVDKVMVVSDHFDANFGEKYGTLVKERRILRRAVFVVDKEGKVVYSAYMPVLGEQPDYGEVLAAARNALKNR